MKILVVDDEELDLFITSKTLSFEYEIQGFTSIKETVVWASKNDFDVVLIDYYLGPGIFATDMLKEILSIVKGPVRHFVLSNYVDEKQILELKNAGFEDIIYKPVTLESFRKKVETIKPSK
ncbi:MAG: response regulator [Chryseolinea sp.]